MAKLIPIKTFFHRHEAETAKGLLKEQGVESIVSADDAGGAVPTASFGMGNVKLLVQESDIPKAKEFLQVLDTTVDGELWEEDMTVPNLPEVKSTTIPDAKKLNNLPLILFGLLLLIISILYFLNTKK